MIRRDATLPDGSPGWLLIPQVEHARISGRLAENWGQPPFAPLVDRPRLLPAIYLHDDGWAAWQQQPGVDPGHGRPYDFTEMPLPDALAIWRRSIEVASGNNPLGGYVVSGHFSALLRRSLAAGRVEEDDRPLADDFLAEQDRRRDAWLADWQSVDPEAHTREAACTALAQLQLFDGISLWLCCAQRTEPQDFHFPDSPALTMAPLAPDRIELSPWPLTVSTVHLETPARRLPAAHYADTAALSAAPAEPARLEWTLVPPA